VISTSGDDWMFFLDTEDTKKHGGHGEFIGVVTFYMDFVKYGAKSIFSRMHS
jgi:hypothetical protein